MRYSEGLKRENLKDRVPLETPLTVGAYIIGRCNLKCNFCIHSLDEKGVEDHGVPKENMTISMFRKIVEQTCRFPEKPKAFIIVGMGEPLMHPDIVEMTKYAKSMEVADRIEIVTNAILMTPKMSNGLIDAGVDRLRISINGLDDHDYEKYCQFHGVGVFDRIVENLRYFHEHNNNTTVYIKAIDFAVSTEEKRQKFEEMFAPLADFLNIEYVVPLFGGVDYKSIKDEFSRGMRGNSVLEAKVCPQAFYTLIIGSDGIVRPCCQYPYPINLGNVADGDLFEIWNGDRHTDFLINLLQGKKNMVCRDCYMGKFLAQPEDSLDESAEEILSRFKKLR